MLNKVRDLLTKIWLQDGNNRHRHLSLLAVCVVALLGIFQNCSATNFSSTNAASSASTGSTGSTGSNPVPTSTPQPSSAGSCNFNGLTVQNGIAVQAFSSSLVQYNGPSNPYQCDFEFRLCQNGNLLGSKTNSTCSFAPPGCTADGMTISGSSVTCSLKSLISAWVYPNVQDQYAWTRLQGPPSPAPYQYVISGDGSRIVGATQDTSGTNASIYISTDQGNTWTQTLNLPSYVLYQVGVSANGMTMVTGPANPFGAAPRGLFLSYNGGVTWTENTTMGLHDWRPMSSSSDGTKMAATGPESGMGIYVSVDSGHTWTLSSAPLDGWNSLAQSGDGNTIVAVDAGSGLLYVSKDAGQTWTGRADLLTHKGTNLYGMALSSDGSSFVIADYTGFYTSTDGLKTMVARAMPPTQDTSEHGSATWNSVALSANGKTVQVSGGWNRSFIYSSLDGGNTFNVETAAGQNEWFTQSLTSDGQTVVAGGYGGVGGALTYIGKRSSSPQPLTNLSRSLNTPCWFEGIQLAPGAYILTFDSLTTCSSSNATNVSTCSGGVVGNTHTYPLCTQ